MVLWRKQALSPAESPKQSAVARGPRPPGPFGSIDPTFVVFDPGGPPIVTGFSALQFSLIGTPVAGAAVPEPSTFVLGALAGLVGLAVASRRRKARPAP